jgi:hypothetical protein
LKLLCFGVNAILATFISGSQSLLLLKASHQSSQLFERQCAGSLNDLIKRAHRVASQSRWLEVILHYSRRIVLMNRHVVS